MEAELLERMREWRKKHGKATFYEVEKELDRQLAELRAQLLGEIVSEGGNECERERCAVCGEEMVKDGKRKRKLRTNGGAEIELERTYLRCAQCGYGFFPPGSGT